MRIRIYTVKIKILLWFLLIMLLSSILSFCVINISIPRKISDEFKNGQIQAAQIMVTLSQHTDLSTDEIIDIAASQVFTITKAAELSMYNLTNNELKQLHDYNYVSKNEVYSKIITLVQLKDEIYVIHMNPKTNKLFNALLHNGLTLAFSIVFGLIFFIFSSKKTLKPIRSLISATQEVARGNFSIRLENKSKDEMGHLIENFNIMIKELGKIEMLRKDFISNVSHEFKTPLSSIQGFATLLKNTNLTDEQKEYTNIIIDESSKLAKLTSNILSLSKLETHDTAFDKKTFFLDEQLRHCLLLLDSKMQEKNINLDIDFEKVKYYGSEELLEQVWINLLENAIKYSNNNGNIYVSCGIKKQHIEVSIRDTGIGMSKETMERIFEKFFQGDKAHSSEGNGLGLALVKRIIDIVGGTIEVESKLGAGSVFTVSLPHTI